MKYCFHAYVKKHTNKGIKMEKSMATIWQGLNRLSKSMEGGYLSAGTGIGIDVLFVIVAKNIGRNSVQNVGLKWRNKMADLMTFPNTVEEFMDQYKITDTEQIYTNGVELVPIFRMKQWFEHLPTADVPERKVGKWVKQNPFVDTEECSLCKYNIYGEELETPFCPWCGAEMETNGARMEG